jgi:hypothetical protein
MKDPQLDAVAAELKSLKARVGALEKLLEGILRQKPVSERQLEGALRAHGAGGTDLGLRPVHKPQCRAG